MAASNTIYDLGSESPFTADTITLVVGGPESPAQEPAPVEFYIHEPVLVDASPVFRAMLTSPAIHSANTDGLPTWAEATTKIIHLPEDRVEDWKLLAEWLYHGSAANNNLTLADIETSHDHDLLDTLITTQPGLRDPALEHQIEEYLTWRATHQTPSRRLSPPTASRRRTLSTASSTSSKPITSQPQSPLLSPYNPHSTLQPTSLPSLSPPLSPSLSPLPSNSSTRPPPPPLGPLLRLYTLADKYSISHSTLPTQLTLRLRAIHALARIVPDREDISRLYAGVAATDDPMKAAVVEMFVGMERRSFARVLEGKTGSGGWNEEFMRAVMVGLIEVRDGER